MQVEEESTDLEKVTGEAGNDKERDSPDPEQGNQTDGSDDGEVEEEEQAEEHVEYYAQRTLSSLPPSPPPPPPPPAPTSTSWRQAQRHGTSASTSWSDVPMGARVVIALLSLAVLALLAMQSRVPDVSEMPETEQQAPTQPPNPAKGQSRKKEKLSSTQLLAPYLDGWDPGGKEETALCGAHPQLCTCNPRSTKVTIVQSKLPKCGSTSLWQLLRSRFAANCYHCPICLDKDPRVREFETWPNAVQAAYNKVEAVQVTGNNTATTKRGRSSGNLRWTPFQRAAAFHRHPLLLCPGESSKPDEAEQQKLLSSQQFFVPFSSVQERARFAYVAVVRDAATRCRSRFYFEHEMGRIPINKEHASGGYPDFHEFVRTRQIFVGNTEHQVREVRARRLRVPAKPTLKHSGRVPKPTFKSVPHLKAQATASARSKDRASKPFTKGPTSVPSSGTNHKIASKKLQGLIVKIVREECFDNYATRWFCGMQEEPCFQDGPGDGSAWRRRLAEAKRVVAEDFDVVSTFPHMWEAAWVMGMLHPLTLGKPQSPSKVYDGLACSHCDKKSPHGQDWAPPPALPEDHALLVKVNEYDEELQSFIALAFRARMYACAVRFQRDGTSS